MIRPNFAASREAPPTRAPSMSFCAISSSTDSGVTLPPYKIRTFSAVSSSKIPAMIFLHSACTDWAISGVATLPVPVSKNEVSILVFSNTKSYKFHHSLG
jgi:hypothetical protein